MRIFTETDKKMVEEVSRAMAEMIDDDIMIGLNPNFPRYFRRRFVQRLKEIKPKWIPQKLWNWLHRGFDKEERVKE